MKNYKILIIVMIWGLPAISYSQKADSLMFYLEMAGKNNPTVQQKFTEYKASLQKVPQAGSLSDPEVSLGVFLSPMELLAGKQVAEIQLMQMFPWFGVLKNAKDEMSLMAKANYESFRDTKLQIFYDVQQTWYELYKVDKAIQSSEKNLELLHTLERLAMVRFKTSSNGNGSTGPLSSSMPSPASIVPSGGITGMNSMGSSTGNKSNASATPSMQSGPMASSGGSGLADLYRIQMEIGELENSIALLGNQKITIQARFNSLLNRPMQVKVALPDTLFADSLNIPLASVSDSMLANHPMLSMLNYEKQSLKARKQMVTRMGYPMVGVGINYSLINKSGMSTSDMNGNDMIMPMIKVTLPVYRKKYKAMQEEADLNDTTKSQGLTATANALQTEYFEAVQNYEDAQRRIKLYARQYELANRSLSILMKSFSSNGVVLTDLLRIRQQTLDYELQKINAVADFNTAIAKLKRLMAYS